MKLHTPIYIFNFLLLLSFLRSSKADSVLSFDANLQSVNACATVNCGQGTCREPVNSSFGFDCDCHSGWTKYQFNSLVFPPCVVPDCTLDASCGTGRPIFRDPPPPFDLSDRMVLYRNYACTITWCGEIADGSCRRDGTGFRCYCSDASDNLLNMTTLPCVKQCALGADCKGLVRTSSSSHGLNLIELRRASKIEDSLKILLVLVGLFHQWI